MCGPAAVPVAALLVTAAGSYVQHKQQQSATKAAQGVVNDANVQMNQRAAQSFADEQARLDQYKADENANREANKTAFDQLMAQFSPEAHDAASTAAEAERGADIEQAAADTPELGSTLGNAPKVVTEGLTKTLSEAVGRARSQAQARAKLRSQDDVFADYGLTIGDTAGELGQNNNFMQGINRLQGWDARLKQADQNYINTIGLTAQQEAALAAQGKITGFGDLLRGIGMAGLFASGAGAGAGAGTTGAAAGSGNAAIGSAASTTAGRNAMYGAWAY